MTIKYRIRVMKDYSLILLTYRRFAPHAITQRNKEKKYTVILKILVRMAGRVIHYTRLIAETDSNMRLNMGFTYNEARQALSMIAQCTMKQSKNNKRVLTEGRMRTGRKEYSAESFNRRPIAPPPPGTKHADGGRSKSSQS